jgi:hypothetical protein
LTTCCKYFSGQQEKNRKIIEVFTYQVRPRKFFHEKGKELVFPNDVELVFHLCPLQLFGLGGLGGSTFFKPKRSSKFQFKKGSSKHQFKVDWNTGRHTLIAGSSLDPLKVSLQAAGCRVEVHGNELHIHEHCQSSSTLEERVQDLFFAIPILLNIELFDSPFIEKVTGKVGDTPFAW